MNTGNVSRVERLAIAHVESVQQEGSRELSPCMRGKQLLRAGGWERLLLQQRLPSSAALDVLCSGIWTTSTIAGRTHCPYPTALQCKSLVGLAFPDKTRYCATVHPCCLASSPTKSFRVSRSPTPFHCTLLASSLCSQFCHCNNVGQQLLASLN